MLKVGLFPFKLIKHISIFSITSVMLVSFSLPSNAFYEKKPKQSGAMAIYGENTVSYYPTISYVDGNGIYIAPNASASIIGAKISDVTGNAIQYGDSTIPGNPLWTGADWEVMLTNERFDFLWLMNTACEIRGIYLRESIYKYYDSINDRIIDDPNLRKVNLWRIFSYVTNDIEPECAAQMDALEYFYNKNLLKIAD